MKDLFFIIIIILLSVAFTDKDLNIEFKSTDSIFLESDNWDKIKDFTKSEGRVKVLENGSLELPEILTKNLTRSLKYELFEDKKTELKLLNKGMFVLEKDLGKYMRNAGIFYLKLHAKNQFVIKIEISETRIEDFRIEVFTKL